MQICVSSQTFYKIYQSPVVGVTAVPATQPDSCGQRPGRGGGQTRAKKKSSSDELDSVNEKT